MNIAMGMVAATVKTPHGDSASAFTTTSASTASRMIMIDRMAMTPMTPAALLISSRTICASDLPSRRIDAKRMTKSCTAPPSTTPMRIQSVPGR